MIDAGWLVLRAAGFILVLQASGAVLFLALCARQLAPRSLGVIRMTAAHVARAALLCVCAQGLVEPLHLAGEWEGLKDPLLWRLAWLGPGAWILWLRLLGLTLLLAVLRPKRAVLPLAAPGILLALGSFLVGGHALVDAHRLLLAPLLGLHVLAVAFWFGALWPLRQVAELEPAPRAAAVLHSFSRRAVWLVPLLGLAGLGLAAVLLPDLAALRRPYGQILCLKLLLFAVLLALAARNKLALVPALARADLRALPALRRNLMLEYALVCTVLTATALLTGLFSPAAGAS